MRKKAFAPNLERITSFDQSRSFTYRDSHERPSAVAATNAITGPEEREQNNQLTAYTWTPVSVLHF